MRVPHSDQTDESLTPPALEPKRLIGFLVMPCNRTAYALRHIHISSYLIFFDPDNILHNRQSYDDLILQQPRRQNGDRLYNYHDDWYVVLGFCFHPSLFY